MHIRVLCEPDLLIEDMLTNARDVFATAGIRIDVMSNDPLNLPELEDVEVCLCERGETTREQDALHEYRADMPYELVIYFVRTIVDGGVGCASHRRCRPSAIVASEASAWTLAHEIGHVLLLRHAENTDLLMYAGTDCITNLPPDFLQDEIDRMLTSDLLVDIEESVMAVTMTDVLAFLQVEEPDYRQAVAKLGPEGLPFLGQLLEERRRGLAGKAVYLAGLIGTPAAMPIIGAASSDDDPRIRVAAAASLRAVPPPLSDGMLQRLVRDPDLGVRKIALRSVRRGASEELIRIVRDLGDHDERPLIQKLAKQVLAQLAR